MANDDIIVDAKALAFASCVSYLCNYEPKGALARIIKVPEMFSMAQDRSSQIALRIL